ncbi:MAG TPA: ATP-binding protein [Micropepsaceae bacterium]|nr:ATP-binding protein [Micropepsaceae bacterium]
MRTHDWSATPLGPPDGWPQSLRSAVSILLPSKAQICLFWGPKLVALYNDAYIPTLGVKHPWALGTPAAEVFSEIWHDVLRPLLENVVRTGEAFRGNDYPFFLERQGFAEETYFDISYDPVRDETGNVGGVFCIVSETTGRVIGDRRLRLLSEIAKTSEQAQDADTVLRRVAELLGNNPKDIGFALLYRRDPTTDRLIRVASAGVEARADPKWPLDEVQATGSEVLLGARELEHGPQRVGALWPEPVRTALLLPIAMPGERPGGVLILGASPRLPFGDEYRDFFRLIASNTAAGVAAAQRFAEERARAEALAQIDAAKTVFFSNVSHEFRTPLTLMLSPLEQLLGELSREDQATQRNLVSIAHRNAGRLLKLANALLDFSRIQAGRVQARYQPTDLAGFSAELASNFRSAIEHAGLTLKVDCAELPDPVFVDRDMWEKIVLNLISNAFKFTLEGTIKVSVQAHGDRARLEVEDSGTGIAEAEIPRLFERFHRIAGARGRSIEGTGIGLALVHELVKLHGGEVSVRSTAGKGSTFTVEIPFGSAHLPREQVVSDGGQPSGVAGAQAFVNEAISWLSDGQSDAPHSRLEFPADAAEASVAQGRKILLADDNRDMRNYVARLLSTHGYAVETVGDGESAVASAFSRRPDLIISDVMMPGLDGYSVLAKLRADPRTADIPIILISARAGEESKVEGLKSGADDYLVKPFSTRELFARVDAAIRLADMRKQAAEAVLAESVRIRTVFEQAPGFIAIFSGPDHVFEFTNRSYVKLVGTRLLIGRTVREALPEVQGQGYFELLDRVYATGERFVGREAPVRLRDPTANSEREVLVDFIYEPIADPAGAVTGIFVEGYEVTERADAQAALAASEEQLRLATDAAEVGLWDVDVIRDTLYWPPRVKAMFGISPDKPVSMADFYAGLHPDDYEATAASYKSAIDPQRRSLYDVEYRTIGKEDGAIRWVAAKGRGIFDDRARCVRIIGTAIDITRRKADEAKLKELNDALERRISESLAERKLLADIVESTDVAVQVIDAEFRLLSLNRAAADQFERLFGVRPAPGNRIGDLLARKPDQRQKIASLWTRAVSGEEFTAVEQFEDLSHARRAYEMKFNVLRDSNGDKIGAYQFAYDVTQRLQDQLRLSETEAALRQVQKLEAMGQLTGGVAHDFNNLLTPIMGGLDILHRRGVGGPREQRIISNALEAAERARTLVHRLLAFARRQPLQPRPVDIAALLSGMTELLSSTMGPRIKLIAQVPDHLPPARADANQLEMAILNLSVNARDAMENGGVLRLCARAQTIGKRHDTNLPPGEYLCLSVADTGLGMDEATVGRAIEPFYSTKGVGKGTGLGLSMVHGLMSQLGGALKISSQKGQGTTVELWLPVDKRALAATTPMARDEAKGQIAGSALLVDDEDAVRLSASEMLAELGFAVFEANSAEKALELLRDGLKVDLLITDHLMPGRTGVDLAYTVRKLWPNVKLLVISGFAEAEGLAPDLERLTKPFRRLELANALSRLNLRARADSPGPDRPEAQPG